MAEKKYTVQERNELFALSTRENIQSIGQKVVESGATTVTFNVPKARFLSKAYLEIDAKVKLKHATKTALATDEFTPYRPIRRVSFDLNNGFSPYVCGGMELAIYNAIRENGGLVYPQHESPTGYCYCPKNLTASTTGASNSIHATIELPLSLNDRDSTGLVLAQNNETNIEIKIDIASEAEWINNADGFTLEVEELKIQPTFVTFSVPAVAEAYPDISVLKLVNSRTETFAGAGENIINLTTGTIYRKLAFIFEDLDGEPFADTDFTSNLDLIFNTADVNYSVPAKMLRHINMQEHNVEHPKGVYIFDFSYNGTSNYGGTRDLIDTEMLTMFQLRFTSSKAGRVRILSECLSRLR